MRDLNLNVRNFLASFKRLSAWGASEMRKSLRDQGIVGPNSLCSSVTGLRLPVTLEENLLLCFILWSLDREEPEFWLLLLALEEKESLYPEIGLLLTSEEHCKLFLLETERWTSRSFFGNLMTKSKIKNTILQVKVRRDAGPIVEPQRKRGYDDKGHRTPPHRWLPSEDYSLREKQEEIERKRQTLLDTVSYLRGFLE